MDSTVRILEGKARQQIEEMKWQQAIASTIRVTDTEAFLRFMSDSAKAIVQVVKIMAPQVTPRMTAQVPEKQIQKYYDSHCWLYPQEEQRKFKFVRFPLYQCTRYGDCNGNRQYPESPIGRSAYF